MGESGCGKTTLIKMIIELEEMSGGKAEFVGFDLRRASLRDLSLIQELQMVFQNPDATMNLSYSIAAGSRANPRPKRGAEAHSLTNAERI
jgi:peptide/nickel transport system ATP-binding protein